MCDCVKNVMSFVYYIDGFVQDSSISGALAIEILQFTQSHRHYLDES